MLIGAPGSGKSDLALRLTDQANGSDHAGPPPAVLVADDQVLVEVRDGSLVARAPDTLRGRLEVRDVGVVRVPYVDEAVLRLAVRLDAERSRERIPDFSRQVAEIAGITLPELHLDPFEASAPAKLRAMVRATAREGFADHVHTT